ncbi:hypothetical protein PCANC_25160 [Puccinia coronata f. sp. avenae]|uniref:Uncharacterized protein n=1 Tax=Puccinia coronata f. sp. avenae TaxID=200324 RepID=A0A2N5T4M5_9BASI|nr:hypothetical protein PCANC_25160 [Puccinia coronata f. sp. avenae]PLW20408.1 hypothetical protein PCASD_22724 [Puccinia coronata f. sp. avenae]
MLAKLVPAQRAGLHACKSGTSPATRPTCSPGWYQPSKQAYLLAGLVPAQQAGLPARQAGTSPASRPTCLPSWYQPSKQNASGGVLAPPECFWRGSGPSRMLL